jgi:hypothetical protein
MTMQFTIRTQGETISQHAKSAEADRRMCRRIVILTLPFFLAATAARRLFALAQHGGRTPSGQRPSLYAEARANAYATIPYMFMG